MGENSHTPSLRVAVIQDGTRRHYAIPRALVRYGALRWMFSEWFLKRGTVSSVFRWILQRRGPEKLRGLIERRCDEIPPRLVRTSPWLVLRQQHAIRKFKSSEAYYAWSSQAVGRWVQRRGLGDSNVLFGFVRNIDPHLCKISRQRGIVTIGDQIIAPAAVEEREFQLQAQRWPGWEPSERVPDFALVQEVERQTWSELDRIICGSRYVRDGLLGQGVGSEKIALNPYPFDAARYAQVHRVQLGDRPLRVGFVGAVNLRKGAPYFFQLARRLACQQLEFAMVGPVQLTDPIVGSFKDVVQIIGRVHKSQVMNWLGGFDIFLFPSTCEGSAGAVLEAMACGIPVVVSPNSGTTVVDGVEGFIRNYDDVDAMAKCVERLAADRQLREQMGEAGRQQARINSLENYGKRLVEIMESALVAPTASSPSFTPPGAVASP